MVLHTSEHSLFLPLLFSTKLNYAQLVSMSRLSLNKEMQIRIPIVLLVGIFVRISGMKGSEHNGQGLTEKLQ